MIDIENISGNEWFKLCVARYLHPVDYHPAIIAKVGKFCGRKLDFNDIKPPVKVKDIYKIEGKNSIDISVFGYEDKKI